MAPAVQVALSFVLALGLGASGVGAPLGASPAEAPAPGVLGEGRAITRVVLRTDLDVRDIDHAREFVHLQQGDVLLPDGVRQSLLNLHGSGLFG